MPADLTASVSSLGVLTLTGTDEAESVTLHVTALGSVTVSPGPGTTINGAGADVPFSGVKSIRGNFLGGPDVVDIHPTDGFQVSGSVFLNLGDGDNTLNFVTSGRIDVGALTVRAGDGTDTAVVQGGTGLGSQVKGAALIHLNGGGSDVTLKDISFGASLTVVAGDAAGVVNSVTATRVTTVMAFSTNLNNSNPALVSFSDCTLGSLREAGYVVGAVLTNTDVNGSIVFAGVYQADLQLADSSTVSGRVVLTAPLASLEVTGTGSTINGSLALVGSGWTSTLFDTTTPSEVKGNVTVRGGWYNDSFVTNSNFKVGKSLTLSLAGGDNTASVGDGLAAVTVGGNLKYTGGAGVDTVLLDRVTLTGAVPLTGFATILTLGGKDFLSIEDGSSFLKTFTADMGAGDDLISIAQNIGASAAVTFTGNAKILGGFGDDLLLLGLANDPLVGGDTNSKAVFNGLTDLVDGGTGIDTFDDLSGQFTGVTPTGWSP